MAVSPATKIDFAMLPLSLGAVVLCCGGFAGCQSEPPSNVESSLVEPEVVAVTEEATVKSPVSSTLPAMSRGLSEETAVTQSAASDPAPDDVSPSQKFRLPDDRSAVNEERLKAVGIRTYESQRLKLLSDLPEDQVAELPALADALFAKLERHFGSLPEAVDGSSFQVTGYLIGEEEKFRQAALMPSTAFTFSHGKHVDYEFWMFNPSDAYYRRHLLLHEFTHCFMTCESGMQDIPPLWYIEGMAEYFATHQRPSRPDRKDDWEFGILPQQFEGFEGWGRISEFRRSFVQSSTAGGNEIQNAGIASLAEVMPESVASFDRDSQYAESWALCWFLNNHADYRSAFRPLSELRRRREFVDATNRIRQQLEQRLAIDWLLFAESVVEGFDSTRSFAVHSTTEFLLREAGSSDGPEFHLHADRDWQDSGLRLRSGETVRLKCEGRFGVNNQPKVWVSEPQGVTVDYVRGLPLGRVVGVLVDSTGQQITKRISVGVSGELTAPFDASLWLQVNDRSSSRNNNSGTVTVHFSVAD